MKKSDWVMGISIIVIMAIFVRWGYAFFFVRDWGNTFLWLAILNVAIVVSQVAARLVAKFD